MAAEIRVGSSALQPENTSSFLVPAGTNLYDWEMEHMPYRRTIPRVCFANGVEDECVLLIAERKYYQLQDGEVLLYVPIPLGGGGGGSNPLKVLAAVALVAFAAPIAGFAGGVLGTTALTTAMVSKFGAAMLLSAFVQPKPAAASGSSGDLKETSPTYSIGAQGNIARLGSPIPRVYGKHLVYPVFIAAPWVEYVGQKQHLTQIFLIGHGKYLTEEPRMEDSLFTSFAKVTWGFVYYDNNGLPNYGTRYDGIGGSPDMNLLAHRVVTSGEVSGQTLLGTNEAGYDWVGAFVVNKAGTEISAIDIDMACPRGLYYANNDGSFSPKTVQWEFQAQKVTDAGSGTGSWIPLTTNQTFSGTTAVSVDIPQAESFGEGTPNPITVTIDTGVRGVSSVAYDKTNADGVYTQGSFYGDGTPAAELLSYTITSGGGNDKIIAVVRPRAVWVYGGDGSDSLVWAGGVRFNVTYSYTTAVNNPSMSGATNEPQFVTYNASVPPGRWQVRGRRLDVKDTNTRAGHELRWIGLKGVLTAVPRYRNVTLLYTRIEASDKVSAQSSRKVNAVVTSILPTYQADGTWLEIPTRNPAWAVADIIRARYGANVNSERYVDYAGLRTLALGCDERGDYFDYLADQRTPVWDSLVLVGRTFRTTPSRVAGKIYFVRDQARPYPVAVYSGNQMRRGSFQIERMMPGTRASSWIEAEYFDAETWNWKKVTVGSAPPDPQATPLQIRLDGVTNLAQATREATYMSHVNKYRRTFVSFSTEMDGLLATYGDLIVVSHDFAGWGQTTYARAVAGNVVTLANELDWDEAPSYLCAFRLPDGSLSTTYTATRGTADNKAVLSSAPPAGLLLYGVAEEPTTVLIGSAANWTKSCIVTQLRPRGLDHVEVTAVVDSDVVYDNRPWTPSLPLGAGSYTVPPGVYKIEVTCQGAVSGESAMYVFYAPPSDDPGGASICQIDYMDDFWTGGSEESTFSLTSTEWAVAPYAIPVSYDNWAQLHMREGFTAVFNVVPGQVIPYYVGKGGTGMTAPDLPAPCVNSGLMPRRGHDGTDSWMRIREIV